MIIKYLELSEVMIMCRDDREVPVDRRSRDPTHILYKRSSLSSDESR